MPNLVPSYHHTTQICVRGQSMAARGAREGGNCRRTMACSCARSVQHKPTGSMQLLHSCGVLCDVVG
jgi:hypothetical protein